MIAIDIFCAGGTIDKVYFDAKSNYHIGEPQIKNILSELTLNIDTSITSVLKKDSLEITEDDIQTLYKAIEASASDKVMVTHGSDTLVTTAKHLSSIKNKTIVLTASLQPALFKVSDATFNIGMAFAAVQTLPFGTYVAMSGRIFDYNKVIKNREAGIFEAI